MTWGWTATSDNRYRRNATWAVELHSGRWYAVRDGKVCLADFADAGGAMAEAERLETPGTPEAMGDPGR